MKELIGYWLIALAITMLITWIEPVFSVKEKIICFIGIMTFLTLLFVGVFFMVGGV